MNSKAAPIEQDPFAMRYAARLVACVLQSLPQHASGVELRHTMASAALERHIPVVEDPEMQKKVAFAGAMERAKGLNQTRYQLDEVNVKARVAIIGITRPSSNHYQATQAMETLHVTRMADAMAWLNDKGWPVVADESKRPKQSSHKSLRRMFRYMRVNLPTEHGAEAVDALIQALDSGARKTLVTQLVELPSEGLGAFSPELLENPYDASRLIDDKIAANVVAARMNLYPQEREPLEAFAETHRITQAVKALSRGGDRSLGA